MPAGMILLIDFRCQPEKLTFEYVPSVFFPLLRELLFNASKWEKYRSTFDISVKRTPFKL